MSECATFTLYCVPNTKNCPWHRTGSQIFVELMDFDFYRYRNGGPTRSRAMWITHSSGPEMGPWAVWCAVPRQDSRGQPFPIKHASYCISLCGLLSLSGTQPGHRDPTWSKSGHIKGPLSTLRPFVPAVAQGNGLGWGGSADHRWGLGWRERRTLADHRPTPTVSQGCFDRWRSDLCPWFCLAPQPSLAHSTLSSRPQSWGLI